MDIVFDIGEALGFIEIVGEIGDIDFDDFFFKVHVIDVVIDDGAPSCFIFVDSYDIVVSIRIMVIDVRWWVIDERFGYEFAIIGDEVEVMGGFMDEDAEGVIVFEGDKVCIFIEGSIIGWDYDTGD